MKNFIRNTIIASAIIFSSCQLQPAFAADKEFCLTQLELAESVMLARQTGVPINRMLNRINGATDTFYNYHVLLVEDAYSTPRFLTEEYKRQAVVDFGTKIYNICRNSK